MTAFDIAVEGLKIIESLGEETTMDVKVSGDKFRLRYYGDSGPGLIRVTEVGDGRGVADNTDVFVATIEQVRILREALGA